MHTCPKCQSQHVSEIGGPSYESLFRCYACHHEWTVVVPIGSKRY